MSLLAIVIVTAPVWGGLLAVIPALRRPYPVAGGSTLWIYPR